MFMCVSSTWERNKTYITTILSWVPLTVHVKQHSFYEKPPCRPGVFRNQTLSLHPINRRKYSTLTESICPKTVKKKKVENNLCWKDFTETPACTSALWSLLAKDAEVEYRIICFWIFISEVTLQEALERDSEPHKAAVFHKQYKSANGKNHSNQDLYLSQNLSTRIPPLVQIFNSKQENYTSTCLWLTLTTAALRKFVFSQYVPKFPDKPWLSGPCQPFIVCCLACGTTALFTTLNALSVKQKKIPTINNSSFAPPARVS